jgi:pyrroline-5-carboxylate reductase
MTSEEAVLLAVKPQQLGAVGAEIRESGFAGVVLTILAGIPSGVVREQFGGAARVVRAMPNTPARVRLGLTGVARGAGASDSDVAFAERLFGAVGRVVRIEESQMDALTAVAGSGPAYVFYLAEAMQRAARGLGLPDAELGGVVAQTILGAAALLDEEGAEPGALRRAVTSKRGTTEAATDRLDEDGVMRSIEGAIGRACERGRELAEGKE